MNKKQTSRDITSLASKVLKDTQSSNIQKQLAGSALAQSNTNKQTGVSMEDKAFKILSSPKYNDTTKTLAGSILSQSNNKR